MTIPNLPTMPELPIDQLEHILDLWQFRDQAMEVANMFSQLLSRLPPYFTAFFALSLLFIVVPLVINLATRIW